MDWERHLENNQIEKLKNSKNQYQNVAFEQRTTSEKTNFCPNTVFSPKPNLNNFCCEIFGSSKKKDFLNLLQ